MYIKHKIRRLKFLFNLYGFSKTANLLFTQGILKPIISTVDFFLYHKNYSEKTIFIAGCAKSGSSWFANMFAELEGFHQFTPVQWQEYLKEYTFGESDPHPIYLGFEREFSKKLAVIKGHTWANKENLSNMRQLGISRIILTVRDPRDMLISQYWHQRNRKMNPHHDIAMRFNLNEYISYIIDSGLFEKQQVYWLKQWIPEIERGNIHVVRYEDLLENPAECLANAFSFFGINVSEIKINQIVSKHSFKRKTGRDLGVEDTKSFIRKAASKEWKTVFSNEQIEKTIEKSKDVLRFFNYAD